MAGMMSLLWSGEYPTLGDPLLVATVTFAGPPRPVLRMWPEIVSPSCQLDSLPLSGSPEHGWMASLSLTMG